MAQDPPQRPARQGGMAAGPLSVDTEEVLARQRNMQVPATGAAPSHELCPSRCAVRPPGVPISMCYCGDGLVQHGLF